MKLVCFPWAGGTSALYAPWLKNPLLTSTFSSIVCVNYPGRGERSDEEPIGHIEPLVDNILNTYECFSNVVATERKSENRRSLRKIEGEEIVLFGHSFGAIVAFEVARRLEEMGRPAKAVFVSASVPPSKSPLVEIEVSKLSIDGICNYFASKGNPVSDVVRETPEFLDMFVRNVRVDYSCLETYPATDAVLKTPMAVIGGGLDPGVSVKDLNDWKEHMMNCSDNKGGERGLMEKKDGLKRRSSLMHYLTKSHNDTIERPKRRSSLRHSMIARADRPRRRSTLEAHVDNVGDQAFVKVYPDQGHFYLKDEGVLADLADFVVSTVKASAKTHKTKEELLQEAETEEKVTAAFRKALGVSDTEPLSPDSHFFDELGGTSLDTMVLTANLQATAGVRISQDEFILHPTIHALTERISELRLVLSSAPSLDPIESRGDEWFPASAGQEQMVALWETAPSMYNMPTTIEFKGNLDVELLKLAMLHVVRQQEGLRTITKFDMNENEVMQKVLPIDLADQCLQFDEMKATNDEEARKLIEKESLFIFNLSKPPVIRAVLVSTPDTFSLLLNQHHVGSDGWSRTQQRRQYLKAYLALKHGREPDTLPKHPSYLDWTMYTRRLLRDHGQKEKQLEYWNTMLQDLPVLDLPLDHMRPLVLSSRGARIPVQISPELVSQFHQLMSKANSNMFCGLLALYMSLLHCWGGGDKFGIGIALANRQHEGLESLVGYFANEVTILADLEDEPSFLTFLGRVRSNVLAAMANSDVPFHEVCEHLKIVRSSSRTSVFQAMFALQERTWHSVDDISPAEGEDDVTFRINNYNHNTSKFEVHLQLRYDAEGGLEGDFHIATDLFTAETGRRMVESYILLMNACVREPTEQIARHDVLPQVDRDLIDKCNSTQRSFSNKSLWDHIESIDGSNIAFRIIEGISATLVSYDDLRLRSKRVAHFIASNTDCNEPTRSIGILIRNCSEGIMIAIGTYLCHSTCVIVDIDKTPSERVNMMFEDAGVKMVIVIDKDEEIVQGLDSTFSVFDWAEVMERGNENWDVSLPRYESDARHPFAVFYTSGTTGLPKGVVVELRNVMNLRNWWVEYFDLQSSDRCMLFSSLSFIMSLRQWLPALSIGASVTIPKSVFEFEEAIIISEVNKLVCTPSALASLDADKIVSVEAVQVAGEAPQLRTMSIWLDKGVRPHIGLGPTELCAHAMCGPFDGETVSIGHPAANVRAYVVNKYGNQVPVGVVGEMWIAGTNVTGGYLNREAETSQHFAQDPFAADSGSRVYKTGDHCKLLKDGRIKFMGRRDKQIKINGYRIEIGDIQGAMGSKVNNSHVVLHKGQLIAFLQPEVDEEEIKTALQQKLPTYMVPSHIISMNEFPLNKNRKVDGAKLLEQLVDKPNANLGVQDATDSYVEKVIKLVWSEVLQTSPGELKQTDNFFSLGGTSLTAVIMSRKLGTELGTSVNVQDVFQHQTIAALAKLIEVASDQPIYGNPDPLTYLDGGEEVMNRYAFTTIQLLGICFMAILVAVPILATSFVSIRSILWFGTPGVFLFPMFVSGGCVAHMILVLFAKWTIMGRFKAGKARVFSWYFLKWWLVRRVIHISALYVWIFDETPIARLWLKLLGASIGRGTFLEQPYILEPDLVHIGNNCVLEFETQLSTSEIKDGHVEFRPVIIGNGVKVGVRSVLLGGSSVADGCEIIAKSALAFHTETSENQIVGGSPATVISNHSSKAWKPKVGVFFLCFQLLSMVVMLLLMALITFVGVSIGIILREKFGAIGLIIYLGAIFSTFASLMFLLLVAVIYRILFIGLKPCKVYSSKWFLLRKWFMDRLLLSPLFRYASERTLQTSSTFPLYLRLLGTQLGAKPWMNHPYFRTGVNIINIGAGIHMGMHSYLSTERIDEDGVSFWPIKIGKEVSFGQRCVALSGAAIGGSCTIGAETLIPDNFKLEGGGTTFGSPPVRFNSSTSHETRVEQLQKASQELLKKTSTVTALTGNDIALENADAGHSTESSEDVVSGRITRRQDVGNEMFWTYIFVMLSLQTSIPIAIGGSYALLYWVATVIFQDLGFQHVVFLAPLIYILGSLTLMVVLKVMQTIGGGFSLGTSSFFSWKFLYWHLLADMIYFSTSTVLYPLSGTQIYCTWLRFMGASIGKNVFISPENGGFREIDFMNIGNNCVLMTPNIHAHYTDHGQLQFCSVILEDDVEVNFGATIMPLTQYQKGCRLRPHAVTVKGQLCEGGNEYFGNPCKADMSAKSQDDGVVLLFPGQGSQYPGMFDKVKHLDKTQELLKTANEVLGYDVLEKGGADAGDSIDETTFAQPLMLVAALAHADLMEQKHRTLFTKVKAVAGFSLGEITALCYAGAITLVDALTLVKARARAMAQCNGGAMCNLVGVSKKRAKSLCDKNGCVIANIICNHEDKELYEHNIFVCAGEPNRIDSLVQEVVALAAEAVSEGNQKVPKSKRLRVSGAFHSAAMAPARVQLDKVLNQINISLPTNVLIYSNVTGRPYKSVSEIRRNLSRHIVKPVKWHSTIQSLNKTEKVSVFVECGPQRVLAKTVEANMRGNNSDEESPNYTVLSSDS